MPTEPRQVFRGYEGAPAGHPVRFCQSCGASCEDLTSSFDGRVYRTCVKCGHIHFRNPSPTVTVMVVDEGRVLLGLREERMFRGGKWCLPGGYMEWDEDFLTAARREVREETGLEVAVQAILTVVSNFHTEDSSTLSVTLLARPVSGTPEPRDETQEVCWHPLTEPLPEMAFEHHGHIIQRYIEGLAGVPVDPRFAGPTEA